MSAEVLAYLFWLVAPVTSAIAFALYLGSLRGLLRSGVPAAAIVGLLLAASWPATYHFIMGLHDGVVLSLLGLFILAWAGIGAPLASTFVAGRKCRSRAAWAVGTFCFSSFLLLVLIALPVKGSNST